MSDPGAPPVIPPPPGQQDNVYEIDPKYALAFTYTWICIAVAAILFRAPTLVRRLRTAWRRDGLRGWGLYEELKTTDDEAEVLLTGNSLESINAASTGRLSVVWRTTARVEAVLNSLLGREVKYARLTVGQISLLLSLTCVLLSCLLCNSELILNSNRAGFMVLSLLPPVFLLATKNSPLAFLLSVGYERLNFLHHWGGRAMFGLACVHGGLWINNRIVNGQAYLLLTEDKERRGVTTLTVLGLIVILSSRPIRVAAWQVFFFTHIAMYTAFFVCVCYHTPYALPWIFPSLAIYGYDLAVRMIRLRVKDAYLLPLDDQMTLVHIPYADGGWRGGQHVRLRVFTASQVFEAHPLSILNSPASSSEPPLQSQGMMLGARVTGDWTRALNRLGRSHVWVMIDGPYGGVHMSSKERMLCLAGGCGATFTLGILDELVSEAERREGHLKEVEWVWFIRSYDSVAWFAPQLQGVAIRARSKVKLRIRIFITSPGGSPPADLRSIPDCVVTVAKPAISELLARMLDFLSEDGEKDYSNCIGRGVGVVVCGPEVLVRDTANAVARVRPAQAVRCGGVELHTERFNL